MQTEKDKKKNLDMKYFEFENILSDEKSYLLRYYLEFSSSVKKSLLIKKNIKLRDEVQFQILREILNAFFSEELTHVPEIQDLSKHIAQAENKNVFVPASTSDDLVNTTEMARILGISPVTLKKYVKANRIKYEQKNGRYYFDRNSKPIEWDKRKGNKRKKTGEETFYRRHKGASAAEVTEHIKKLKLFTDAVAPFIRTMEELDYYVKHDYHEVCFDGRPALIIDVNPDYIHSKTGVRNRDLMKKGDAPAVPHRDKEDYVFNVHHVGQLPSSPFAIIPSYDHTGGTYTKYFHPAKVPNEDLHGPEFEAQKINFWRSYLEAYDKARIYGKISFLNSKHTKGKR